MNHFTFNDVLKMKYRLSIHTDMHFSLGVEQCEHETANQEKRDKGNKCTFVFLVQKGNTNVPLISKRTVFVCSKTQQKIPDKQLYRRENTKLYLTAA